MVAHNVRKWRTEVGHELQVRIIQSHRSYEERPGREKCARFKKRIHDDRKYAAGGLWITWGSSKDRSPFVRTQKVNEEGGVGTMRRRLV